jgi:hypothetical protein
VFAKSLEFCYPVRSLLQVFRHSLNTCQAFRNGMGIDIQESTRTNT